MKMRRGLQARYHWKRAQALGEGGRRAGLDRPAALSQGHAKAVHVFQGLIRGQGRLAERRKRGTVRESDNA